MKDMCTTIRYKDKDYNLVFNLNVMETIQAEYGSLTEWSKLTDASEPDAKAVIFGIGEMINEGIDISNEENGTDIKPLTHKQIGRMITEVGMQKMTQTLTETVIKSTESAEKNA